MPNHDEHILNILAEATEPLFPPEITDHLNRELGAGAAYTMTDVVIGLNALGDQVEHLPDGRWMLKRRMA
jgi:hypothetical protein